MKHDGWEVKKLGEICETITKGTTPKTIGYDFTDSGINFIKVESINELGCFITENFTHISNECHKALMRSQLEEYDMLFSIAGALGRTAIVDKSILPANTNQALSIIRLKEKNVRFLYYLQYYLKSDRIKNYIDSIKVGVAQMNLSLGQLKEFPIIIPPLPEQFRIVEELDQLSNIIEKKRQQLSELDNLAQSIFYDMFDDIYENKYAFEIKELNEVFEFIKDGTHQTPQYVDEEEGVKFLSAKDVVKGFIDWNNIKYISDELHLQLSKRVSPQRDDILLCKNGTYGICALVETDDVFDIYVSLALMRPKKEYCPRFLVYAINNPITKEQFDKSIKGVGVPNLHLGEIKKAKIIIPPLHLQQLFAQKIEAIEKEKELIKQSIKETEELFNSRMDYYFG